jgi:Ca-activated chloride channel family protein
MRTVSSSLAGLVVLLVLATSSTAGAVASSTDPSTVPSADRSPAAEIGDESGRLVLVLDSSGSMKEPATGGGTKIEAAKSALRDVVDELPDAARVGVRVFGAKVFDRSQKGACTDTQNVVPVGPLDRTRLRAAVDGYEPYGETPIGNALKGAARDLGPARDGERRTIVLLSDGEPTCAPDPCTVGRKLRERGIDLRINVVGLEVSGKARSALQCIAREGGGRYFDASSAEELTDSMVQVSVRALRLFSLSGEPVSGGTSTAEPTEVEPGDYVDETLPDESRRFYAVDVPDGGSVSASAVMRPEAGSTVDTLRVELLTPEGDVCADDLVQRVNVIGLRSIVGTAAHFDSRIDSLNSEVCAAADQLLVSVSYEGPVSPFGLRVRTYPGVANVGDLPGPVESGRSTPWERTVALSGAGAPAVGGGSFEGAPELTPGRTYRDTLRPREQLIYKVPVAWGQAPRMTARVETDPTAGSMQGALGLNVRANAFNPLGAKLTESFDSAKGVQGSGFYNGDRPLTVTAAHPPVRWRNLESTDSDVQRSSVAGYYYFTLEMSGDSDRASERFQAPVRLAVAVDGQEGGSPEYDGEVRGEPAPSASAQPEAAAEQQATEADDSSTGFDLATWALPAAGVALVVALALVGGFVLGRRGR